jgi:hypothetical protein
MKKTFILYPSSFILVFVYTFSVGRHARTEPVEHNGIGVGGASRA